MANNNTTTPIPTPNYPIGKDQTTGNTIIVDNTWYRAFLNLQTQIAQLQQQVQQLQASEVSNA